VADGRRRLRNTNESRWLNVSRFSFHSVRPVTQRPRRWRHVRHSCHGSATFARSINIHYARKLYRVRGVLCPNGGLLIDYHNLYREMARSHVRRINSSRSFVPRTIITSDAAHIQITLTRVLIRACMCFSHHTPSPPLGREIAGTEGNVRERDEINVRGPTTGLAGVFSDHRQLSVLEPCSPRSRALCYAVDSDFRVRRSLEPTRF